MIIVAVSQRVDHFPARDEVRDALDQRLASWLQANGCLPVPVPNRLADVSGWLARLGVQGLVLSGGNDIGAEPLRDATERAMLAHAMKHRLPLLGICRGMQMLALWAGGQLEKVSGHVGTRHRLQGQWAGQMVPATRMHAAVQADNADKADNADNAANADKTENEANPAHAERADKVAQLGGDGMVNSFHNLALVDCPPGFVPCAQSEDGSIEAIAHQDLPWQGWMWHPEREAVFARHDNERLQTLFGSIEIKEMQ